MASSLIAAWLMLQSITLLSIGRSPTAAQQHLEATARTAAELKAGQPFEIVLRVSGVRGGDAGRLDALVAAVRSAGGGRVAVRWMIWND